MRESHQGVSQGGVFSWCDMEGRLMALTQEIVKSLPLGIAV
jgi:hypothetical protein